MSRQLRKLMAKDMTPPMRAILEPKVGMLRAVEAVQSSQVDLPGDYAHRRINSALVPVLPGTLLSGMD